MLAGVDSCYAIYAQVHAWPQKLILLLWIYHIYQFCLFGNHFLTTTNKPINTKFLKCFLIFIEFLGISTMWLFVFYWLKDIIYRRNDRGKENLKAKCPCHVAEGEHYEIRSYIYQSWSAILHKSGHSSTRICWPVVWTSGWIGVLGWTYKIISLCCAYVIFPFFI